MKKRILARLLQTPAVLLLSVAFLASAYLAVTKQMDITYGTPVILVIILGLYFWGRVMESKTYN
jgi:hypothetical protein